MYANKRTLKFWYSQRKTFILISIRQRNCIPTQPYTWKTWEQKRNSTEFQSDVLSVRTDLPVWQKRAENIRLPTSINQQYYDNGGSAVDRGQKNFIPMLTPLKIHLNKKSLHFFPRTARSEDYCPAQKFFWKRPCDDTDVFQIATP